MEPKNEMKMNVARRWAPFHRASFWSAPAERQRRRRFSPALRTNPKRCRTSFATALHIGRDFLHSSHNHETANSCEVGGLVRLDSLKLAYWAAQCPRSRKSHCKMHGSFCGFGPGCAALYRIVPHCTALRGGRVKRLGQRS